MKKQLMLLIMALAMAVVAVVASGCSEDDVATTTASCAFIVNDSDTDKSVDKVLYPGQSGDQDDSDETLFFPCNSRTYGINEGNKKNANNERIGDRFTLAPGTTESGTDIKVAVTAYWTLNQNEDVLKEEFRNTCEKYGCWSSDAISNSANYADPGWNGMLGENMGEPIDRAMRTVTPEFSDSIWQKGTQTEYNKLGEALSKQFAADVRKATGYSKDLFCGSGSTSGWPDPDKPGKGEFKCSAVRFIVDDVVNDDRERQEQANEANGLQSQIEDNEKELRAAKAKYGPQAEFWLGAKDYAESCGKACPAIYMTDDMLSAR